MSAWIVRDCLAGGLWGGSVIGGGVLLGERECDCGGGSVTGWEGV